MRDEEHSVPHHEQNLVLWRVGKIVPNAAVWSESGRLQPCSVHGENCGSKLQNEGTMGSDAR